MSTSAATGSFASISTTSIWSRKPASMWATPLNTTS
jgi:hypothetical protein